MGARVDPPTGQMFACEHRLPHEVGGTNFGNRPRVRLQTYKPIGQTKRNRSA